MLFHNIIKKLVRDLSNSQRIRRTTSLSMKMCVRSRVIIPSQNHVNRQEAVRARSSQSPSQRSQMPRAARARISQCQQFEFSVFLLITSKRAKESFVRFSRGAAAQILLSKFFLLYSITFLPKSKNAKPVFSEHPKSQIKAAVLLFFPS